MARTKGALGKKTLAKMGKGSETKVVTKKVKTVEPKETEEITQTEEISQDEETKE